MDTPLPQLLQHLTTVQTLLAASSTDHSIQQLQDTLYEVAAAACGERDTTSKDLGTQAIVSLLKSNLDLKYLPALELLELLKTSPGRVFKTLDEALQCRVLPETLTQTKTQTSLGKCMHKRILVTPEKYSPVLTSLFSLQICNPHIRIHLVCKMYLEAEVVLDIPVSGEISLWWGKAISEDLLWRCATWQSKFIMSWTYYSSLL
jgi:hypothetical protein